MSSIGAIVFGMEDGTVSIFGLVLGVAASATNSQTVLLAGATGAISAAVSMMAGTYLDVSTERDQAPTFADWMQDVLREQGLTQEAAARQLGVSVKTVSRWVGGATEPRMRDLRRIQEVFGEFPLP